MQTSAPTSAPRASTAPPELTGMPTGPAQHEAAHAMEANTACHHALQTRELLENILVHLPIKDLFVHHRVSKQFQATIAGSPTIRRKVFLTINEDTPRENWNYICRHRWDGRRKRLEKLAFELANNPTVPRNHGRLVSPVILNPILEVFSTSRHPTLSCIRRMYKNRSHHEHVRLQVRAHSVGWHSSLLATYISDPPCKLAIFRAEFTIQVAQSTMHPQNEPHSLGSEEISLRSETGLKLGDLWEAALDAPGDSRWKCPYGIIRSKPVSKLRNVLKWWREPSIALSGTLDVELLDVVVPAAEEWAAVR